MGEEGPSFVSSCRLVVRFVVVFVADYIRTVMGGGKRPRNGTKYGQTRNEAPKKTKLKVFDLKTGKRQVETETGRMQQGRVSVRESDKPGFQEQKKKRKMTSTGKLGDGVLFSTVVRR